MVYKLKCLIVMFFEMFEFFLCKSILYLYFFFIVFNVLASRQNRRCRYGGQTHYTQMQQKQWLYKYVTGRYITNVCRKWYGCWAKENFSKYNERSTRGRCMATTSSRSSSRFPNNKTSLLDYAARFVSLVQQNCLDKEIQLLNLRNTIKDVIANRLFSASILSWVIGKIEL